MARIFLFLLSLISSPLAGDPNLKELFQTLRDKSGLSTPLWSDGLAKSCADRAEQLAHAGWLSHEDDRGNSVGTQELLNGGLAGEYGEVLAAGPDALTIWRGWLQSPPHRSLLLEGGWTRWAWADAIYQSRHVLVLRLYRP